MGALTINDQTGTTYTLVLTDADKYVRMDNAAANTLTVPPNADVAFDVGTQILVASIGAGQTTIAAGSGVSINTPETMKLRKQGSKAMLIKTATDLWEIAGDLEQGTGSELSINEQTGTSYTLVAGDAGKVVTCENASAVTLTVPPNSGVAFAVGTQVLVAQVGAGQVTIAQGSGVTIRTPETLLLRKQYAQVALVKIDTDEWLLDGNLEAA